jgi:hypothetical protein
MEVEKVFITEGDITEGDIEDIEDIEDEEDVDDVRDVQEGEEGEDYDVVDDDDDDDDDDEKKITTIEIEDEVETGGLRADRCKWRSLAY